MTIKEDFKPTTQFYIVSIGNHLITGFPTFRRFKDLGTINELKQFYVDYEEWQVPSDGNVYEEFYTIKRYLIVDITDVGQEYSGYTNWFSQLSPVLLPAINSTLSEIPQNENNYVVKN